MAPALKVIKQSSSRSPALRLKHILVLTAGLAVCLALLNLSPQVLHGDLGTLLHTTHRKAGTERVERGLAQQVVRHNFAGGQGGGAAGQQQQQLVITVPREDPAAAEQAKKKVAAAAEQTKAEAERAKHAAEEQAKQQAAAEAAKAASAATAAQQQQQPAPGSLDQYHVVMTTNAATYTTWQSRIHYYWYKKVKSQQTHGAMGGFTRLLTGRELDGLEGEIPTILVDPLPPDLEKIAAGYVVLDRPYAFQQWVHKHLASLPEKYIFMAEPDHIFLQAPPLWATPQRPAAFPFFYIEPLKHPNIVAKFNARNVSLDQMDPVGNSPVMIHKDQFASIVDTWMDLSFKIKADKEADNTWGWVQEMYAYSISSAQAPTGPIRYDLRKEIMLQPPWDTTLKASNGADAFIIHYTYGNDFDDAGQFTPGKVGSWHWDKRDYIDKYPPKNFRLPPAGCTNLCVIELVKRVNEAASSFPDWDAKSGRRVRA